MFSSDYQLLEGSRTITQEPAKRSVYSMGALRLGFMSNYKARARCAHVERRRHLSFESFLSAELLAGRSSEDGSGHFLLYDIIYRGRSRFGVTIIIIIIHV